MYSGSFPGPAAWEVGGDADLLPAGLEPRPATWAVTFHVVVAAGDQRAVFAEPGGDQPVGRHALLDQELHHGDGARRRGRRDGFRRHHPG